jgi:hypothetical protein
MNPLAPIQPDRAFKYLLDVCKLGSRMSGSPGMEKQQRLLAEHFGKFKAKVSLQAFDAPHPLTGNPVRLHNLIVTWDPDATERVLLCCHYDTRPLPDRDPNPQLRTSGEFIGANDGGSGVAVLMELANHMRSITPRYGVDFVFFDAEELIYSPNFGVDQGTYFLGSIHFAREYVKTPPAHRYLAGVLVDMVGDRQLQIYMEANSLKYAPGVTKGVFDTAAELKITEFVGRVRHEIRDDHLPLNEIAKIPTTNLIDFDFPHWHTSRDVPAACSGQSLAKVARVLLAWLENPRGVDFPPAAAE